MIDLIFSLLEALGTLAEGADALSKFRKKKSPEPPQKERPVQVTVYGKGRPHR